MKTNQMTRSDLENRAARERAEIAQHEGQLNFILPLKGTSRMVDERIEYLTDILAGLRGDLRLTEAEMRRTRSNPRNNGVHDPNILKAIFLAGGPGSGKSFVASSLFGVPPGSTYLVNSMTGLKVVNSDPTFEYLLTRVQKQYPFDVFDLASLAASGDPEKLQVYHYLTESAEGPRSIAKRVKQKQAAIWEQGRLGLVIDGTGDDFEKIQKEKLRLDKLGYDTYMVFVNTSLPVALARNKKRKRKVAEDIAVNIWNDCQRNLGLYQNLFGSNFRVIDNSEPRPIALDIIDAVAAFLRAPVYNSRGRDWAAAQGVMLPRPTRHRSPMPTGFTAAPKRRSKHKRPELLLKGEALMRYGQMRPEGEALPIPAPRVNPSPVMFAIMRAQEEARKKAAAAAAKKRNPVPTRAQVRERADAIFQHGWRAGEIRGQIENMLEGDDSEDIRQYYPGWRDEDFDLLLTFLEMRGVM